MSKILTGSSSGNSQYNVDLEVDHSVTDRLLARSTDELEKALVSKEEATAALSALKLATKAAYDFLNFTITGEDEATIKEATDKLNIAKAKENEKQDLVDELAKLEIKLKASIKKLSAIINEPINTTIWSIDLTDNSPEGKAQYNLSSGDAQAIELFNGDGSNSLVSGRGYTPADGILKTAKDPTPWGAFYNMAILPAMQKWRPRFKSGTISNLDKKSNTCSITFTPKEIHGVSVNKSAVVYGVSMSYLNCNAYAFDDGDLVVVEITGINHDNYEVIGFVSNPQGCDNDRIYFSNSNTSSGACKVNYTVTGSNNANTALLPYCSNPSIYYDIQATAMYLQNIVVDSITTTTDPAVVLHYTGGAVGFNTVDFTREYTGGCTAGGEHFGRYYSEYRSSVFLTVGAVTIPFLTSQTVFEITKDNQGNSSYKDTQTQTRVYDLDWICLASNRYSYKKVIISHALVLPNATVGTYPWAITYDRWLVTKDSDGPETVTHINTTTFDTSTNIDNLSLSLGDGNITAESTGQTTAAYGSLGGATNTGSNVQSGTDINNANPIFTSRGICPE